MVVYERIKELCKNKKITIAELERALKISNGTIGKWRKAQPRKNNLQSVADYFNVSVDYLLGREKSPTDTESMSDDEIKALAKTYIDLEKLAKLSPSQLQALANIIEEFANQNK